MLSPWGTFGRHFELICFVYGFKTVLHFSWHHNKTLQEHFAYQFLF